MAGKVPSALVPHSISIAAQVTLLLTDAELWTVAPSHAYGLLVITALDFAAYPVVLQRVQRGRVILAIWSAVKLALFLGDIFTAPEFGLTYAEFAAYLFSLPAYVIAVVAQPLVIALSLGGRGLR
ncbi:MAG: hypothetical protein NZ957_04625 [Thaumarchaeota archaeon]|nr:hypothetical protein [Candidatus Calditenuaceae archaeon]MDW8041424.1 hypothetical protein [Nitrososphaerota archaeon]